MFYSIPSPAGDPSAAVADAESCLRNDIATTVVSGTMNHSVGGGALVVVDWPMAGHWIWVILLVCFRE